MRNLVMILTMAVIFAGCSWVGTSETIQPIEQNSVDISKSFYMIYPATGSEQTFFTGELVENEASAKDASDVFYKKFFQIFGGLVVSESNVELDAGLETAATRGDKYLIAMDIHEWKDSFYMTCQATESGVADQLLDVADVTVRIYDVASKQLINSQRIYNSGCPVV
ncbi:MAG: DUF4823 domain-containing protein [Deferribacteraceae bacterium]|jgi:hypothetical protein|nr:DUF4823 domain-containing protein [Deferribacteraceae bacterium]